MNEFSPENVSKALRRIPELDSGTLREWVKRGHQRNITEIVGACERELVMRGPRDVDVAQAKQQEQWAAETQGMTIEEAILFAFTQRPANMEERAVVRQIVENENPTYSDLVKLRGKGDVALILGHFVYERYGCFKPWIADAKRISDVLFDRDDSGPSMRYQLTPQAQAAFEKLGLT